MTQLTTRVRDYVFHFPEAALQAAFTPILPSLLDAPQQIEGYAPLQRRKGEPVRVFRIRVGGARYVAKWSRSHSAIDRARNLVREPKGRIAWKNALRLRALGFDTPSVAAYAERRIAGFVRRSFLVTDEVTGARRLNEFLHQSCAATEARALRWTLMRLLGALLARLHKAGVYHADLRAANILVQTTPAGPRLFLVDTEAVQIGHEVSEARRLKNFTVVNFTFVNGVTFTDRMRVFDAYGRALGLARDTRKKLLRKVIAACEKTMHTKVFKPQLRPYRIPSGLPYRAQIVAIQTAIRKRIEEKSGRAPDLLED